MSLAYLHSDNMEDVRERLENTIENSSVETMYDGEDCFITVTQRNGTTGNESKWSFCVDFGDFRITMLEPVEDIEYFGSDNEIFGIIKNFINGGSSREKRMNRPDYDRGEPIKITGFGNKIGSARKPIKSSKDPYAYAEAMDKVYKYAGKKITNQPIEIIKILDDGKRSGFLTFIFKSGNNTYQMTYDYGFGGEKSGAIIKKVVGGKIESSRKLIKSSHDRETLEKVIRAYLNDRGYKDVEGGISAAADYIWQNEDYYTDYDLHSKVKQWFKETLENYPETLIKASRTIKSDYSDEEYWYPEEDNEYVVQIINRKYEEPYYSYITETNRWDGNLEDAKLFTYENAMKEREEMQHFFAEDGLNVNYWVSVKKLSDIKSSHKPIKSDYSDEEYWYPETKKVYRLYKYNSNGDYYTWDYDTLEEAQRMKPRGNRYTSYNIKEVEVPVQSSRKSIKSDFNPYYEKHPDTPVGYLLGGPVDTVTDTDKKAADEYGLFYEGYGTMDGTEKGHLFIGEYQKLKSYFEDYMGHSLADDYIYPYEDSFGQHILDRFEIEMTWVLPTEKDYQDIVNKLNEYVDKEYGREFGTGSIYHFNMYKGRGTNTDGYGHEYPNYVIFDTEGNLDLFSDDEIVQYIDNLLAEKGWYHEAVSGSDNFTIAVDIK